MTEKYSNAFKEELIDYSVQDGVLESVKYLLKDETVSKKYNVVFELLDIASSYGHLDIIKYLIDEFQLERCPPSIIEIALIYKHMHVVDYLLSIGTEINYGEIYLTDIISHDLEVIKDLITKGAKIDNESIKTAIKHERLDIIRYVVDELHLDLNDDQLLQCAVETGNLEIVQLIVDNGASIFDNDDKLLYDAIEYGHVEVLKYLISRGMHVRRYNDYALCFAISIDSSLEIIQVIVENDGDVTANYNYPIIMSARKGNLELFKYLHQHGADIYGCKKYAIMLCINNKHKDILKYILEQQVDDEVLKSMILSALD